MKTFRHIVLILATLFLASCVQEDLWDGIDRNNGEEVVMTFSPKFEDFETVTKAIGDGKQVDMLLVEVYESNTDTPIYSKEFPRKNGWDNISLPFFYGKTYQVYFWAYAKEQNAYTIEDNLKGGVTVNYPASTESLGYAALEYLDAYYAVETVNLSDDIAEDTSISLTRPFAQVNLVADITELETAKATNVEFTINVATSFIPGGTATTAAKTFTFTSSDFFKSNEPIANTNNVYLGTTYVFVPSDGKLQGTVTLSDSDNKVLRGPSDVEFTLANNHRTNLQFVDIQPAEKPWDDSKFKVPGADADGWIHISCPEELAALLVNGAADGSNVHICEDIDMEKMPDSVKAQITGKSFMNLTLDGDNKTIKNLTRVPAFIATGTNITITDLTFDNIQITGATHVGTLVNVLNGNGSFTNVTVKNSNVTTKNGAAGGFVGYSARISEKDRRETLAVTFSGCSIEGSKAAGSQAEGKYVGLFSGYDNGEKLVFTSCSADANATVADYSSRYVEGNEGAWLADNNYSAYNGFLGDETYFRGKVYFGGENEATNRFCAKWDGTTNTTKLDIEPLLANATYDAGTTAGANRYVVYSPFDLAGVRKKTASPAAIYLMNNVDMFGQGKDGKFNVPSEFTASAYNSTDDNNFNSFSYVSTLEGFNNTIYNLKIEHLAQGSTTAAFIGGATGTTYHQNTTFDGCCVVSTHKDVTTDAKAYAAIVCCNPGGTYTMEKITARNCKTFGLQKVGTLCSRVSGTSTLKNNTVSKCYVENYECDIVERFESGKKTMAGFTIDNVYADFYPHGEVGGMYGFIQGTATLSNCQVIESTICAYGQGDKMAEIKASGIKGAIAVAGLKALGYYKVPGRHVNAMIGNIRVTGGNIAISGCTIDANSKCTRSSDVHNSSYKIIGQAYYVFGVDGTSDPGTVTVDNNKLKLANCNAYTQL